MSVDGATADEIADWLRAWSAAQVRVLGVVARIDEDSLGDLALFLDTTLADPRGETWPPDELLALRRELLGRAIELEFGHPVYVSFRPESEDGTEDTDAAAAALG